MLGAQPKQTWGDVYAMPINHLLALLELYPREDWWWNSIFGHPRLPFEYLRDKYLERSHFHRESAEWLSCNPNVTNDTVLRYPKWKWNYSQLCRNPSITPELLHLLPNKSWDWSEMQIHFPLEFIMEYHRERKKYHWFGLDGDLLSLNDNLTMEFVESHPEIRWNYKYMMERKFVCPRFIEQHPELYWPHWNATNYTWFDIDFIRSHPEIHWDSTFYARNPNFTPDVVEENSDIRWSGYSLSSNPSMTLDFIDDHPELEWRPDRIAANLGIPISSILKRKQWHMHFSSMSGRDDLTAKIVVDHPKIRWSFSTMSRAKFNMANVRHCFTTWHHKSKKHEAERKYLRENIHVAAFDMIKLRHRDRSLGIFCNSK